MNDLLDTCVVSVMISRQPSARVRAWLDSILEDRLYLSVLTMGEIRKDIEKLPDSERRDRLNQCLTDADRSPALGSRICPELTRS